MEAITLQTDLVKLRPLEPTDLNFLRQVENNPEFWTISQTVQPFSDYTLAQYIEQAHQDIRSEEHTSELQSRPQLVCRLLLEKKNGLRLVVLCCCKDQYDSDPFMQSQNLPQLASSRIRKVHLVNLDDLICIVYFRMGSA